MITETSPMPPTTAPAAEPPRRALYWRLWAAFPRDIGYLALTGVLVVVAFAAYGIVGQILVGTGNGLFAFVAFFVLLLAGLYFGRLFGAIELVRLSWARHPAPRPVAWRTLTLTGRFKRLVEVAADPHYWLYFAFTTIVFPWLGALVVAVTVGMLLIVVGGIVGGSIVLVVSGEGGFSGINGGWVSSALLDHAPAAAVVAFVVALGALALLPFVTRGMVLVQGAVATWMLGGFRSEQLKAEVAGLEVSRSAAVSAEGTALRRLERDIHDGPQQRLIRLQMDLSAASRVVDTDGTRARLLIDDASAQAREALEELRALSRGFAPPLLLDRGLAAALDAVVDRSTVPTRFTDELPDGIEIPVEIERNAYFIAAELLANIGKHSRADRAELILSAPTLAGATELRVIVTDDGAGGATVRPGHGLAGIEERLVGLGGRLELRSPEGGPTHASVRIPMAPAVPEAEADAPVVDPDRPRVGPDQPAVDPDQPHVDSDQSAVDPDATAELDHLFGETPPDQAHTRPYPTEELPRVGDEPSDPSVRLSKPAERDS
ncbi:sensor histidine kinase [Frondihabitans sp. VKM Ac-2883]|uniref:sensor histidine kinase n=1 Tax=Frondihabitans sp. VKM Ac-2883 TaxID=2783823 RepID=UPI00188B900A|nr:histidine kinase [Frondihabitans sp. VKM Ac-2883]MBF4576700.1 sensor histidine kinase [Frondihabitans sp. VKM Ac-2883]